MSESLSALVIAKTPEDRREIMDLLSNQSPFNVTFSEAETGPSGVRAYDPTTMDFAVVERFLPHMNGLDVVRILRATYGNSTPVILLTSESSREAMEEALTDLNVNGYVLKPLTAEKMQRALKGLVEQLPERHPGCTCGPQDATEVVPAAAIQIISEMCNVEASLVEGDPGLPSGDVLVGIISLFGDIKWSIKLQLPKPSAEMLVEKFAGFAVPFDSPDMADAVGELTNVTVGQIKRLLVSRGMDVEISLPTVFRAAQLEILLQRQTREMLFGYDTPAGRFWTTLIIGDLVPS